MTRILPAATTFLALLAVVLLNTACSGEQRASPGAAATAIQVYSNVN